MSPRTRAAAAAGVAATAAYAVWQIRHRRRWDRLLTARIPDLHSYWRERGKAMPDSVLYVALGDSAALGQGASQPSHGYVGLLAAEIGRATGRPVRVRNLAIDGARLATVLTDELHRVPDEPAVVCTLAIGANDVWTFEPRRFREELTRICAALPPGTLVGELPSFSFIPVAGRIAAANRIVHEVAAAHGLWVAPLHAETAIGGPITAIRNAAGDLFHPNDRGHARWAAAFLPGVRARLAASGYGAAPRP